MTTELRDADSQRRRAEWKISIQLACHLIGDAAHALHAVTGLATGWVQQWLIRDRHWRRLDRLSDHTLKDIGLERHEIRHGRMEPR